MEEIPTLERTEDIELVVYTRQTTPNTTPVEVPHDSGDEEEESIFHDALTDLNAGADEQLTATAQSRPDEATEDGTFKSLKKLWNSISEKANSIIGIGVFILTIIGVVYTVWTANKDYYEYCYEGSMSEPIMSLLKDGISPPFHWHTVKSLPDIAASTLRQGQNMTLSTLDSRLSNTRPAVVFLSGALCSLLLAGICFCIVTYGRPVRKVLIRTVRQPEAWVATVVARQAHHLKGRQQQWRTRQTKNKWTTAVKSGVASSDLHRPRRGFTRTDSDVDSEATQPFLSEDLSEQAQMRCNAEILVAYISHLRECYAPRRPAIFIGHLPYASDHEKSIVSCSRIDLRQSLHNVQPRSTSSAAVLCQQDTSSASSNYWMLQLPWESSLSEKLLTMKLGSGAKVVFEADHFCAVRQTSISAACHINHFFSIMILGNTSSNDMVILVRSHSKFRYRAFLAELQDSEKRPQPPIWFKITPVWRRLERNGNSPEASFSHSYLPDLELSDCLKESAPFFAFRCIGENPTRTSPQDDLFLPVPDLQELHMHWNQGSCELSEAVSDDEVILTCSGDDKWRPNLSSEDGTTSVYNQDATSFNAICRVNDWLLHKLRCSTIELNNFTKNLPEPLSTFLLEDPDLNSNLTNVWMQNRLNCGLLDIGTSYDARRYSGSEYSLYQLSASSSSESNKLTQNASSTVSISDYQTESRKPAHLSSTLTPFKSDPVSISRARYYTKADPGTSVLDRENFGTYVAQYSDKTPPSNPSISSIRFPLMPEKMDYAYRLAYVNMIREKLIDREKAHDELKHKTAAKEDLDLGLDTAALEALQRAVEKLSSQLDRAQADFELAEVNLQNRRRAFAESDLCTESPEDIYIQHENLVAIYHEAFDVITEDSNFALSGGKDLAEAQMIKMLYSADECPPVFSFPGDEQNQGSVNKATFINQWLLDCLRHSPENVCRFIGLLDDFGIRYLDYALQDHDVMRRHWHEDGTELVFALLPDFVAGLSLASTLPVSANGLVKVRATSEPGVISPWREGYKRTSTG